jgi:hypothetical protein
MTNYPTNAEARLALQGVERAREHVINQVGLPSWYWWGLAACWIGLGVSSDIASPWVTGAATLTFGAIHSSIAPRLLAGRQRTGDVKVRADVAGRRVPALVFACLIGLVAVTIVAAFAASADGAQHPATIASAFVAVLILLGGPRLMAAIRADAIRRAAAG